MRYASKGRRRRDCRFLDAFWILPTGGKVPLIDPKEKGQKKTRSNPDSEGVYNCKNVSRPVHAGSEADFPEYSAPLSTTPRRHHHKPSVSKAGCSTNGLNLRHFTSNLKIHTRELYICLLVLDKHVFLTYL